MWYNPQEDKKSLQRTDNIEALLERLGSLKITNKTSNKTNEQSDEEISVVPVPVTMNNNVQTIIPKYSSRSRMV